MSTGNKLLDRLPAEVLTRLEPHLRSVSISHRDVIYRPGDEIVSLFFPLTSVISLTVTMTDGSTVEVGAVGSREVAGINALLGGRATTQTSYICQLPGEALTIRAEPVRVEFDRNTELRSLLLTYAQAKMAHISQNAACNRLHALSARSARWLLELCDRVGSEKLVITQEFIADMLGVTRPAISPIMREFKDNGLIDYARGNIVLIDPPALKREACECYDVLVNEYDRLLGFNELDPPHCAQTARA